MESQDNNEKCEFFAQYLNLKDSIGRIGFVDRHNISPNQVDEYDCLKLKSLSLITDDEIQDLCMMIHNLPKKTNFEIDRKKDIIHCSYVHHEIKGRYHICFNYKYATINSNLHFSEFNEFPPSSHKVNSSEIHFSAERVVGYIQAVDYLRSKGYAIPFRTYSIQDLIKKQWLQLIE